LSFETFVGWRYLFRRGGRAAASALFGAMALFALGAGTFVWATAEGRQSPFDFKVAAVSLFLGGFFFAVVTFLLRLFSVFTTVAITGVTLGVAALVVVLGVTSGFQREFQDKVLGVNAHVIVMKGGNDFPEYRDVMKRLTEMPGVLGASPFIFTEMQAAKGAQQSGGLLVKGIEPKTTAKVLDLRRHLEEGSKEALSELEARAGTDEPGLIIGASLAKKLKVKRGDQVRLLSPLSGAALALKGQKPPKAKDYRIVGVFFAGFDEYDKRLVYVDLWEAQRLRDMPDNVNGVETRLADPEQAIPMARKLEKLLGPSFRIIDWQELNHNLFTALKLQKIMIFLFLTLIVFVAAFNIVASLTLIVMSKRREISMLKSMGARSGRVARVFQVAGMTIGSIGVTAGIAFGMTVCWAAQRFGYPLDPKIYMISRLPVRIEPMELVTTAVVTMLICFLATIYPAVRASRLEPVEGLRQE
jgi:lipoprotein-releasing system permease protein